ncbi:hypothetical protein BGZ80_009731 [Entomortierella chlamydospora]|uniref:Uncharacterized protein n=1 Tax=Entomortierella chlamydospora TaxID=101097 RepID=A0A9P6MVV8_9FUNG|nr:hypothetical protein BGZ79_007080 [Entomortierella chlamydospora]KAG0015633.1 hypothetical protein BGZ80_009731 [Entomortierella chlamydospora]
MSDTIAKDATPHPRNGISPLQSVSDLQSSQLQQPFDPNNNDDSDDNSIEKISHPHSRQSNGSKSREGASSGFRPSIFGHGLTSGHSERRNRNKGSGNSKSRDDNDIDSELSEDDDDDYDDDDDDNIDGIWRKGRSSHRRRRRRKRMSASASHLLAQAPPVPDLRFDHNFRKALDQIYEAHASETAHAAELNAAAASSLTKRKHRKVATVPSIVARITVMTLRDIIIMPFIHGFFWGFGTILLTLASQRTLIYHLRMGWRRIFGGNIDDVPVVTRGEPARVRVSGSSNRGLGGIGLMNTGSRMGQPGFGRPAAHIY